MRRTFPNFVILRPIRSLADMVEKERKHLLKQMDNYLGNCEAEDQRLSSLKERVNR
jgi:hypothetical protein